MSATTLTGERLSFRSARLHGRPVIGRIARPVARNRKALRASLQAAKNYDAARTSAARRQALRHFQSGLPR